MGYLVASLSRQIMGRGRVSEVIGCKLGLQSDVEKSGALGLYPDVDQSA